MKSYNLILVSLCLVHSSCSSLERVHYYEVSKQDTHQIPEISYEPEIVIHQRYRKDVGLTYKRSSHFFSKDDVKQIVISVNYFSDNIAWGPLFLPLIPYLGSNFTIDKSQKLHIYLRAWATGPFYKKDEPALPQLVIVTKNKGVMSPIKVETSQYGYVKFTYDTTVEETPVFHIRQASVSLGEEILKIPDLKFVFSHSLNYEWMVQMGP